MITQYLAAPLTSLALAVTLTSASQCADTGNGPSLEQRLAQAQALIEPWASDNAPGLAVAVSLDDSVVFERGAGLANVEHGVAITPQTAFQVASVSKQFTAFAVLLLASEGRIDLDADIRTYVPELAPTPEPITITHLLDHTGGLREITSLTVMGGWLEDDIRERSRDLELILRQEGVNFPAGARVEYSNTGYMLLAETVARVSGVSFPAFVENRIFDPLGMERSAFRETRHDLIENRALSYFPTTDSFGAVIAANDTVGSTGLYTTVGDLLLWADNFETRRVGDDFVFDHMAERATAQDGADSVFAKGQELRIYNGIETWSHGGTDAGFRSFLLRAPEHDLDISLASNRTDFDSAGLAFALLDAFLDGAEGHAPQAGDDWSPATPDELAAFAGDYEIQPGMIFTIARTGDGLAFGALGAELEDFQAIPQVGERRFMLNPNADVTLVFDAPDGARSAGFDYTIGLHGSIRALRVELAPYDPTGLDLASYEGVYDSEELGTSYTVTVVDGVLTANHSRRPSLTLTPYQTDTFSSMNGGIRKAAFVRNSAGEITGFRASAPLVENVTFQRRPS